MWKRAAAALGLLALLGLPTAAGAHGSALPAGWRLHEVPAHGFALPLPRHWLPAREFMSSSAYFTLKQRRPEVALEYAALIRDAEQRGVWFFAVNASSRTIAAAAKRGSPSFQLLPTIFVVPARPRGALPIGAPKVVPRAWRATTPETQGCSTGSRRPTKHEEGCGYQFVTQAGRLLLVQQRAKGRPAGRPSLVLGWARADDRARNIRGEKDPDEATWYGAIAGARYLPLR